MAKRDENQIDVIQDFEVEQSIQNLRNPSATGMDIWFPTGWKRLQLEAKADLANNLRRSEELVAPPFQALYQIMAMMQKPIGGGGL